MKYKDYYQILEINKDATPEEVKKSYRKLAKKYHPDANPGDKYAEERFKDINESYEVLSDEVKRKKYDQLCNSFNFKHGFDFDPSQFGFGGQKYDFKGSETGPFSDFFDMFFSSDNVNFEDILGGFGFGVKNKNNYTTQTTSNSKKGEDLEAELEITLEEAFWGCEKNISLKTSINESKKFSIKVPAGIRNGEKIRLAGQGKVGPSGSGDLFIKIKIKEHDRFELDGSDMIIEMPLSPWEAALGCKISIPSLDGNLVVNVPPAIQSGQRLRLTARGYKSGNGGRGDLFVEIKILVPKTLTDDERMLFEKLGEISKFKPRET